MVLFIMLYNVDLTYWVCGWNLKVWPFRWTLLSSTSLLCCLLCYIYKVVLTFESVDEILKCDHSKESDWTVLSCGAVYYAVQGSSYFWVCGWNLEVWSFKWKLLNSTFLWRCLLCYIYKVVLTFESLDEIRKCNIQMKATEQYFLLVLLCCTFHQNFG